MDGFLLSSQGLELFMADLDLSPKLLVMVMSTRDHWQALSGLIPKRFKLHLQ